jgi:hypothetical protein
MVKVKDGMWSASISGLRPDDYALAFITDSTLRSASTLV